MSITRRQTNAQKGKKPVYVRRPGFTSLLPKQGLSLASALTGTNVTQIVYACSVQKVSSQSITAAVRRGARWYRRGQDQVRSEKEPDSVPSLLVTDDAL